MLDLGRVCQPRDGPFSRSDAQGLASAQDATPAHVLQSVASPWSSSQGPRAIIACSEPSSPRRRLGVGLGGIALFGGLLWAREARQSPEALDQAKREIGVGLFSTPRGRLAELAARRPGQGDLESHLGLCEQARGRDDDAMAASSRVVPGSPEAAWAALQRARMEIKRGRLAVADDLFIRGLSASGSHTVEATWERVRLLRLEGRFDEARRLFRERLDELPDPVQGLKGLYQLDHAPFPPEAVRDFLGNAARRAPDDDRVWLRRAQLNPRSVRLARRGPTSGRGSLRSRDGPSVRPCRPVRRPP